MGRLCLCALPDGKAVANRSFWDSISTRNSVPPLKYGPALSCHPQPWNSLLPSLGTGNLECKYFRFCRPDSLCCNIQLGYFSEGNQVQGINNGMWVGSNKTSFKEVRSWQKTAWKPSFFFMAFLDSSFVLSAWQEPTLPQQDTPRQYISTLV